VTRLLWVGGESCDSSVKQVETRLLIHLASCFQKNAARKNEKPYFTCACVLWSDMYIDCKPKVRHYPIESGKKATALVLYKKVSFSFF